MKRLLTYVSAWRFVWAQIGDLRAELTQAQAEIRNLRARVVKRNETISDLMRQLESARRVAAHNVEAAFHLEDRTDGS